LLLLFWQIEDGEIDDEQKEEEYEVRSKSKKCKEE
jgi:hypothetical protein